MFQLAGTTSSEQIIKKSRFLATALVVTDEQQVRAALSAHAHADANHNCWAWRIGQAYRFSDDGEPTGTGGKPILAAIDGQSIDNVLVIVTRWFGGVLLGTGGLVRAYGGTAGACLRAAELIPITKSATGTTELQFSDLALVKARLMGLKDVGITDELFTATGAAIALRFPEEATAEVSRLVSDLTSGRSHLALDQD